MSAIFGGSKSKQSSQSTSSSSSANQAYPYLQNTYAPVVNQGNQALSQVSALLGLGGDTAGANKAFDAYRGSTDYDFTVNQGQRAINNNAAVGGLLGSGKTLKALTQFGQNTAQKYLGDYIARLLGIGSSGLQAGGLIAGAGGTSQSQSSGTSTGTSSSTPGLGGFVGSLLGSTAALTKG